MKPRYNKVPGDLGNVFDITGVLYSGVLFPYILLFVTLAGLKNNIACYTGNFIIKGFVTLQFYCMPLYNTIVCRELGAEVSCL